jgi:hypothetical protein
MKNLTLIGLLQLIYLASFLTGKYVESIPLYSGIIINFCIGVLIGWLASRYELKKTTS